MMLLTPAMMSLLALPLLPLPRLSSLSLGFSLGFDRQLVVLTDLLHLTTGWLLHWSGIGVTGVHCTVVHCSTLVFYSLLSATMLVTTVGALGTICF